VVLALVFAVFCAREDKEILDSFEVDTAPLVLQVVEGSPKTLSASTSASDIIGGERDLALTDDSGPNNSILTAGVSAGEWSVAAPHSASGYSIMQYDGVDGSPDLKTNGLANTDLTADGADSFHLTIQADQDTQYTLTIYSTSGTSTAVVDIPGDETIHDYYIDFSDFNGQASFTAVGAIELRVELFVDVDSFIELFATSGTVATPTPSPPPPPPPPSGAPAPPPPSKAMCHCDCPTFHCGVVFATPGDDDDSVDDDTHDDDEFVYRPVYYGPEDDDFEGINGDDDDNEMFSFEGQLALYGNNARKDIYSSVNGSTSLVVSVFLLSIVALLI